MRRVTRRSVSVPLAADTEKVVSQFHLPIQTQPNAFVEMNPHVMAADRMIKGQKEKRSEWADSELAKVQADFEKGILSGEDRGKWMAYFERIKKSEMSNAMMMHPSKPNTIIAIGQGDAPGGAYNGFLAGDGLGAVHTLNPSDVPEILRQRAAKTDALHEALNGDEERIRSDYADGKISKEIHDAWIMAVDTARVNHPQFTVDDDPYAQYILIKAHTHPDRPESRLDG